MKIPPGGAGAQEYRASTFEMDWTTSMPVTLRSTQEEEMPETREPRQDLERSRETTDHFSQPRTLTVSKNTRAQGLSTNGIKGIQSY